LADKFSVNYDHYETEAAQMAYVFNRTSGDAKSHIRSRYNSNEVDEFKAVHEMVKVLRTAFVNPYKTRDKRDEYKRLYMGGLTFNAFYTKFLQLARDGKIHKSDFRKDLIAKITNPLKELLMPAESMFPGYRELAVHLQGLDQRLRAHQADKNRYKASFLTRAAAVAKPSSPPVLLTSRPTTTTTLAPTPAVHINVPFNKGASFSLQLRCYNCGGQGHIQSHCRQPQRQRGPAPRPSNVRVIKEIIEDSGNDSA